MHTDRIRYDLDVPSVDRSYFVLLHHADHAADRQFFIMDHSAFPASGHKASVGHISSVRKYLSGYRKTDVLSGYNALAPCKAHENQR